MLKWILAIIAGLILLGFSYYAGVQQWNWFLPISVFVIAIFAIAYALMTTENELKTAGYIKNGSIHYHPETKDVVILPV